MASVRKLRAAHEATNLSSPRCSPAELRGTCGNGLNLQCAYSRELKT